MKNIKLAALTTLCMPLLAGTVQAAEGVLISEYIEGSGNNKALEIYNGSGSALDLGDYAIQIFFNGANTAGADISLSGSLADGEVFVLAHSSADAALVAAADQTYGGGLFNGDDAVALVGPGGFVDVIGQIGMDPGNQWGDASVGTQNQTLRRNPDILLGRSDGGKGFAPAAEWSSADLDDFADLGQHGGSGSIALGQCGETATLISAIQGSSAASPLAGERREIEAVVVGDFQDTATGLGGFFVQEEDADQDGLESTSEGLFVYDNGFGVDIEPGDLVRVGGVVSEFYDFTELKQVDGLRVCGSGHSVGATEISLPFTASDYLERFEGMLAHFPQALTVSGNYNLGRYGELDLSAGRRYVPTHNNEPGAAALAQQAANNLNRVLLDDGSSVQNAAAIPYPTPGLSAANSLRSGVTVTDLTGVIGYGFGAYRVHPVATPQFVDANPRSASPVLPGTGSLRIASLNVLNYFNGDGLGGGFPTSRGADTLDEFQRQRDKIIAAILNTGADIVGLMEIENDGYGATSAIQDLVNGLNAAAGSPVYAIVNPGLGQLGDDEIAVGMIYRSDRVQPLGSAATLDSFPFDDLNRQPLLQAFTEIASSESVAVVVNHFKSKGSCPADGSLNDDQSDGQGCWNLIRTQAADALAAWLASDPAGNGVERTLVLGDLNSYARENPISTLAEAGYIDLLNQFGGNNAYSYVFDGQAGYLDHALANAALAPLVTGATEWHINADEPRVLDYNTEYKSAEQIDSLYSADPYRASDHDPLVVEFDLTAGNSAPVAGFTSEARGKQLQFVDTTVDSDGEIVAWHWQFGDGATSSQQHPRYRYRAPGSYTVTLGVEDDRGAIAMAEREIVVTGEGALAQARFSVQRLFNWVWIQPRGKAAQAGGLAYHWDFGDGNSANRAAVWHRYDQQGEYTITLRVSDPRGQSSSASKSVEVRRPWLLAF